MQSQQPLHQSGGVKAWKVLQHHHQHPQNWLLMFCLREVHLGAYESGPEVNLGGSVVHKILYPYPRPALPSESLSELHQQKTGHSFEESHENPIGDFWCRANFCCLYIMLSSNTFLYRIISVNIWYRREKCPGRTMSQSTCLMPFLFMKIYLNPIWQGNAAILPENGFGKDWPWNMKEND